MNEELVMSNANNVDARVHLCDYCTKTYPSCDCGRLIFGSGRGDDNVIVCDHFVNREAPK